MAVQDIEGIVQHFGKRTLLARVTVDQCHYISEWYQSSPAQQERERVDFTKYLSLFLIVPSLLGLSSMMFVNSLHCTLLIHTNLVADA